MNQESKSNNNLDEIDTVSQDLVCKSSKIGYCKVCNDMANETNSKILVCYSCKEFFRRSLINHIKYKCYKDQRCNVKDERRKSCKYCRLKLCFEAGMSFNRIKLTKKLLPYNMAIPRNVETLKLNSYNQLNTNNQQSGLPIDLSNTHKTGMNAVFNRVYENAYVTSIMPITSYSQLCFANQNQDSLILITLLRDKSYQLFNRYIRIDQSRIDYARKAARIFDPFDDKFPGWNASLESVHNIVTRDFLIFNNEFTAYLNELPGFNSICREDFEYLVYYRQHFVHAIKYNELFVNDEFYHVQSGVQITKSWLSRIFTRENSDVIFKFHRNFDRLKLVPSEIAVLIPAILSFPQSNFYLSFSSPDKDYRGYEIKGNLRDPSRLLHLNEQFKNALIYQLKLNKKSDEFIRDLIDNLEMFEPINETLMTIYD